MPKGWGSPRAGKGGGRTRFYLDQFMEEMNQGVYENMKEAMTFASEQAKRNAGRAAPGKRKYSRAGEFPFKRSGELQRSIQGRVDRKGDDINGYLTIGTPYGLRIELGFKGTDSLGRTINQAERPVLRRTIYEHADQINKLITKKVKMKRR